LLRAKFRVRILTTMTQVIAVFWDVTACSMVEINRRSLRTVFTPPSESEP